MITVVVGKEIEKIKGDFESYLNGLNMVGEISYSQYSKLYDEGAKQIQKAYELGKAELEKENAEQIEQLTKAKEIIRGLLNSCFGYNSKTVNYEVKVKAEQFLKEVVEDERAF